MLLQSSRLYKLRLKGGGASDEQIGGRERACTSMMKLETHSMMSLVQFTAALERTLFSRRYLVFILCFFHDSFSTFCFIHMTMTVHER